MKAVIVVTVDVEFNGSITVSNVVLDACTIVLLVATLVVWMNKSVVVFRGVMVVRLVVAPVGWMTESVVILNGGPVVALMVVAG